MRSSVKHLILYTLLHYAVAGDEYIGFSNNKQARIVNEGNKNPSLYIAPSTTANNNNVIELEVPVDANEKNLFLQLPQVLQQQQEQQQHQEQQQNYPAYPYPQYTPPPRKHYKITIVRQPSRTTTPAPLPEPEVEEKTLIYVLVKKPDEADKAAIEQQVQQQQEQSLKINKPEVYFISYKANQQKTSGGGMQNGYGNK